MVDRAERGGGIAVPISAPGYQVTARARVGGIETGTGADWFGPLNPMAPSAPPEVLGRILDYPSGYNLNQQPRAYERITFDQLRGLADAYDLMRLVIETRKDQMTRLPWNVKKRGEKGSKGAKTDKDQTITKLEEFLRSPDRVNPFDIWLRMILEDLFVVDAATLFVRRTRGGEVYSLEPLDGATIKRVIDDWGRTPDPPLPAYQQVLKGLPAVNYTTDQIIYLPRNKRTSKIYGYSPVEQVVMTVNIALRRQVWQLQYFTEGNIPEALIGVPETWTPEQVAAFQAHWDSLMEGNTAQRRHARFVPGGVAKTYVQTKDPEMMNVFDEWLARVVCYAFSVSAMPFVRMMNRASGEIADTMAIKEGMYPIMLWVKNLMDRIILKVFEEPDYEFVWERDAEPDVGKLTEVLDKQLKAGAITLDEYRDEMGRDPYPDGIGEKPMIYGAGEPVLLEDVGLPPDPDPLGLGGTPFGGPPQLGPDGKPLPPKPKLGPDGKPIPPAKPAEGDGDPRQIPSKSDEAKDDEEVAEKGATPFGLAKARRAAPKPLSRRTRTWKRSERLFQRELRKAFRALARKTAAQIREKIAERGLTKGAADELDTLLRENERKRIEAEAEAIANGLDFEDFQVLIQPTEKALALVAQDAGARAVQQIVFGSPDAAIMNQVHEKAKKYAEDRAAEMVGMRWDAEGNLAPNPSARWAINDSTRDLVRAAVVDALSAGDEPFDLEKALMDGAGFSQQRAETVARTELARAHVEGTLAGYKEAAGEGVAVKKQWLTAEDHKVDQTICAANAKQGAIGLDEKFQSGDDGPPGHPNCRCDLLPVLEDDES